MKLTKAIPLFSLKKPINYPTFLELIFEGLDNTFFRQRLKKESVSSEESAALRVANPQVDSTKPNDASPP